jgi:hypothetical protein
VNADKASHIEVIIEADNVANLVALVQSSSGVCDDDGLDAEELAYAGCEGGGVHGMAFVEVGASDEESDGGLLGSDLAENEFACVADHCNIMSAHVLVDCVSTLRQLFCAFGAGHRPVKINHLHNEYCHKHAGFAAEHFPSPSLSPRQHS